MWGRVSLVARDAATQRCGAGLRAHGAVVSRRSARDGEFGTAAKSRCAAFPAMTSAANAGAGWPLCGPLPTLAALVVGAQQVVHAKLREVQRVEDVRDGLNEKREEPQNGHYKSSEWGGCVHE